MMTPGGSISTDRFAGMPTYLSCALKTLARFFGLSYASTAPEHQRNSAATMLLRGKCGMTIGVATGCNATRNANVRATAARCATLAHGDVPGGAQAVRSVAFEREGIEGWGRACFLWMGALHW